MSKRPPGTSPISVNLPTPLHTELRHAVTDLRGRGDQVTGEMLVQLGIEVVLSVIKKYPSAPYAEIELISKRRRFKSLAALDELRWTTSEIDAKVATLKSTMAELAAMDAEDAAAATSGKA